MEIQQTLYLWVRDRGLRVRSSWVSLMLPKVRDKIMNIYLWKVNLYTKTYLRIGRTRGMIAMSGSPLSPFAIDDKPQERSKRLAEKNGCPTTSTIEMVKCLRELSAEKLVAAETELEVSVIYRKIIV